MRKIWLRALFGVLFSILGVRTGHPQGQVFGQGQSQTVGQASGIGNLTVVATPPSGVAAGPLVQSGTNSHYLVIKGTNTVVYLTGSHSWDDFDDTSQTSPSQFPFSQFVNMLKFNNQNATVLWHKDLPSECAWQNANWKLVPQPWIRSSTPGASDGGNKFDLSQFNQTYFDRLRLEANTLYNNGIYAIVELFDGNNVTSARCGNTSPNGDGFPFTSVNNINGVSDGYTSGACGVGAFTMGTNNGITAIQDAYVKKVLDTLNDLPNILYEVAEEQPGTSFSSCPGYGGNSSMFFWAPHMFGLVRTYEAGGTFEGITYPAKPLKHPVGIGSMNFNDRNDAVLYSSAADWIAPTINATTFPANVAINNQAKVVFNDSDHSLFYTAFVNGSTGAIDDVSLRTYVWENFTNGASGLFFMDPYLISIPGNQRNPCANPVGGICPQPMTKYDPFRKAMGYTQLLIAKLNSLVAMTPQPALSSTGFALANNNATTSEYVVYAPSGGTFTVNLSGQPNRFINISWLDPTNGSITTVASITGGSATQSFTPPWGSAHDAVLHLTDGGSSGVGGALAVGWTELVGTTPNTVCPSTSTFTGINGSEGCAGVMNDWNGGFFDTKRQYLEFWGGGHAGYYGNEIYRLDLVNRNIARLTDPATNPTSQCNLGIVADMVWQNTTPNVPHGYQGMTYMSNVDKVFYSMGDMSRGTNNCPSSVINDALGRRKDTWLFDTGGINYASLPNAAGHWTPLDATLNGGLATGPTGSISFKKSPKCTNTGACTALGWARDGSPLGEYASTDWWPKGQQVIVYDQFAVYLYDPITNIGTQIAPNSIANSNLNTSSTASVVGSADVDHDYYYIWGNGLARRFHMDTWNVDNEDAAVVGCSTPKSITGPGIAYDTTMHLYVIWGASSNTQTVWLFNGSDASIATTNYGTVGALTCVAVTPPLVTGNAPPAPPAAGTNGRFRFIANFNNTGQDVYALCPQMNSNCFALALNAVSTSGHQTFAQRVASTNVVYSSAMDTTSIVNTGAIPSSGDGVTVPVFDTTVAPTGDGTNGSAKFVTAAVATGADMSGSWRTGSWTKTFGPSNHPGLFPDMYWQFRIKEDPTQETTFNWAGPSFNNAGQKIAINHFGGSTCNSIEITWQDNFGKGTPQMYSACGAIPFSVTVGGDTLIQQGSPIDTDATVTNVRYNCHNSAKGVNDCAFTHFPHGYSTGWQTYYCHAQFLGEWNTSNNAHIKCWIAYEKGTLQPDGSTSDGVMHPVIDFTTSLDCNSTPGCRTSGNNEGYNAIDFTMYETSGAPAGAPNNATRWYGCIIVASSPIAAPDGPTPQ